MAETDGDEGLDDLPPSAKLVYKVLEYDGPLTQKGIVEESMLSARTVRYALERLEGIGVVDEDVYFADARQNLYQLTDPETIEADGGVDADPEADEVEEADPDEAPHAECD
ncbi:MAG: ArsR family transcriptional regulator [Haloferacaceae archaeon]